RGGRAPDVQQGAIPPHECKQGGPAGLSTARVVVGRSHLPAKLTPRARSDPSQRGRHPPSRRLSVAKVGGTNNESGDVLFDRRAFLSCARRRLNCGRSDNSYGWTGGREKRLKRLGLPAGRVCGGPRRSRLLSEC